MQNSGTKFKLGQHKLQTCGSVSDSPSCLLTNLIKLAIGSVIVTRVESDTAHSVARFLCGTVGRLGSGATNAGSPTFLQYSPYSEDISEKSTVKFYIEWSK